MTELAKYEEPTQAPVRATRALTSEVERLTAAHQLGSVLCKTSFVPQHFRGKPDETAVAIMFGDDLGFNPVQALRSIYVISGTPALYARAMVALVQSHGHEVWTVEDTTDSVTVSGRRKGTDQVETVTWTGDRAKRAGYTNNKKYATDPQAMLYARASGDVCRRIAADVLLGMAYTVEEIEIEGELVDHAPAPASRKVTAADILAEDTPTDVVEAETVDTPHEPSGLDVFGPATNDQLKRVVEAFQVAGITDKQEMLDFASQRTGRPLGTAADMSVDEADDLLSALNAANAEGDE